MREKRGCRSPIPYTDQFGKLYTVKAKAMIWDTKNSVRLGTLTLLIQLQRKLPQFMIAGLAVSTKRLAGEAQLAFVFGL